MKNEVVGASKKSWERPEVLELGSMAELTKLKNFTKVNGIADDLYQNASSV